MTLRQRDNLIYGGIALGSVAFLVWVIPAYTPPYPGYGVSASLLPNVTVGIILALSVLALIRNILSYVLIKKNKPEESPSAVANPGDKVYLWHLARFMIPCVLLMPAMKWAGFIPAGIAFMLLIQFLCGQRKPVTMVLVAVGLVGALFAVMRYGLGVPMP
ncbi:MAG: tripartite tricarboxylate transporter TctB family protein [Thermodesulfobacteriota bacterium]